MVEIINYTQRVVKNLFWRTFLRTYTNINSSITNYLQPRDADIIMYVRMRISLLQHIHTTIQYYNIHEI